MEKEEETRWKYEDVEERTTIGGQKKEKIKGQG